MGVFIKNMHNYFYGKQSGTFDLCKWDEMKCSHVNSSSGLMFLTHIKVSKDTVLWQLDGAKDNGQLAFISDFYPLPLVTIKCHLPKPLYYT